MGICHYHCRGNAVLTAVPYGLFADDECHANPEKALTNIVFPCYVFFNTRYAGICGKCYILIRVEN